MQRGWRIGLVLTVLLLTGSAWADAVPAKNQALLLLRILAYDHNLANRTSAGHVTIVIVYKAGNSDSEDAANGMGGIVGDIAKSTTIAKNTISVVRLAYSDKTFDGEISRAHAAALYVAPGLGDSIGAITTTTQGRKLLSFSGVADYVASGIAVGFALDDGKPEILVNLPASRSEGADLDVALLRVAKIVKK
jgi:hypothetical protein